MRNEVKQSVERQVRKTHVWIVELLFNTGATYPYQVHMTKRQAIEARNERRRNTRDDNWIVRKYYPI